MIKPNFYSLCSYADYKKIFAEKGYAYFTNGAYNLNIIGVRSDNKNKVTNLYDDILVVIYKTPTGRWARQTYQITTEPGLYYMIKKQLNPKGTSILVPGQYRGCWEIGKHKGKYEALVQRKPIKVYRDNNRDAVYDMNPERIDKGIFKVSNQINEWSAGCQVFADPNQFKSFMDLCKKQRQLYGNTFTYTLLNEEDVR